MRILFYIQLLITILTIFYLFTFEYELLILIFLSIVLQAIILYKKIQFLTVVFILFHLAFLGLMNLPFVGFIFAALYLLVSLLLIILFNNITFLFSSSFKPSFKTSSSRYKNPHFIFLDLVKEKARSNKNSDNSKDSIDKNYTKKSSFKAKSGNLDKDESDSKIKDVEFREK